MAAPPLLDAVLEAHGGPARWAGIREITARLRSGGFALATRGKPRAFRAYEAIRGALQTAGLTLPEER